MQLLTRRIYIFYSLSTHVNERFRDPCQARRGCLLQRLQSQTTGGRVHLRPQKSEVGEPIKPIDPQRSQLGAHPRLHSTPQHHWIQGGLL